MPLRWRRALTLALALALTLTLTLAVLDGAHVVLQVAHLVGVITRRAEAHGQRCRCSA